MPHLLRQVCAAFLVRDLRLDWRWGAEWFESRLLDYTPDANWGNWGYRILPVPQILPLESHHLTSLEIMSWPIVHDPHLDYTLQWVPELREIHKSHGAIFVREPWRIAPGYRRVARVDVRPKRDSPLWVMSVNRVNWPEYQQMMTGYAWKIVLGDQAKASSMYPLPLVPPLELEILYDKIPLDHSWGGGKVHVGDGSVGRARSENREHTDHTTCAGVASSDVREHSHEPAVAPAASTRKIRTKKRKGRVQHAL